jgi:hypothetical protein
MLDRHAVGSRSSLLLFNQLATCGQSPDRSDLISIVSAVFQLVRQTLWFNGKKGNHDRKYDTC